MKRRFLLLVISLLISVVVTFSLLLGAGFADAACHCMTVMFMVFPYGGYLTTLTSWESFGSAMLLLQFPFYALILVLVRKARWKIVSLLLILMLHCFAAWFGLRAYCQSRHTCGFSIPSTSSLRNVKTGKVT